MVINRYKYKSLINITVQLDVNAVTIPTTTPTMKSKQNK